MSQNAAESQMSIGELAGRAGLSTSAVRFYEGKGLLAPPRRVGGKRRYEPAAVSRLLMIRFCQQLGFTLAEIHQLATPANGGKGKQEWRDLVDRKLGEVDSAIEQAQVVKRLLEESRECDCLSPETCRFIERVDPLASPG